jgi:hypothetical protein
MKDLIHNDISRCNDYKCPIGAFCARFRQLRFDKENGNTQMSVTDFKGREKKGLCDYFLNADILASQHEAQRKKYCCSLQKIKTKL